MLVSPQARAAYSGRQRAPRRRWRRPLWRPARLSLPHSAQKEHRIPERIEVVALPHGDLVRLPDQLLAPEAHHHREERRAWQVEVRQERVHGSPTVAWIDEERGLPFRLACRGPCFERAGDGRARSDDAARPLYNPRRLLRHAVVLGVHPVLFEPLGPYRHERPDPDVECDSGYPGSHPLCILQYPSGEVKTGRRGCGGPSVTGVDRLVSALCLGRGTDVRRERHPAAALKQAEHVRGVYGPVSVAQALEKLQPLPAGGERDSGSQAFARPGEDLPRTPVIRPQIPEE